jgi:hypothetical protein
MVRFDDEYHWGYLQKSLPIGLCWERTPHWQVNWRLRGPSWTWVSFNGPIHYDDLQKEDLTLMKKLMSCLFDCCESVSRVLEKQEHDVLVCLARPLAITSLITGMVGGSYGWLVTMESPSLFADLSAESIAMLDRDDFGYVKNRRARKRRKVAVRNTVLANTKKSDLVVLTVFADGENTMHGLVVRRVAGGVFCRVGYCQSSQQPKVDPLHTKWVSASGRQPYEAACLWLDVYNHTPSRLVVLI